MKRDTYKKQKVFPPKCDIFITYRFDEGKIYAKDLYDKLKSKGYWVCLDLENPNKKESKYIFSCLDNAKDFILILPPHALDFGRYSDDTAFQEKIKQAIKSKANIIPIELDNFKWPESTNFPESLRDILEFQSILVNRHFGNQEIIKLTKRNRKSKKKFLKSKKHLNQKVYCTIIICALFAIFIALSFCYVKSMPVFFLNVTNNKQLQDTLENRYKHWDKCYAITNTGGRIGNININPTATIEIIVDSETEGHSGRMGSITIGIKNYFEQIYHIDGKTFNSVSIAETKSHLIAEYLAEIVDSLQKQNLNLIMYSVKIHFLVTYRDMLGPEHNIILEPDFDYDFSCTAQDEETEIYLLPRTIIDTTLYKRKSVLEPYIISEVMNDDQIVPNAEQIAQIIDNNKKLLFDKDCNFTTNNDGTLSGDTYYIFSILKNDSDDTIMLHAEHDNCVLLENN